VGLRADRRTAQTLGIRFVIIHCQNDFDVTEVQRMKRGPPRPARSAAFLLAQLGAHAASRFGERIAPLGVVPSDAGILRAVGDSPGISQQGLAAALSILPSRLVALLDDLAKRGLVERRDHPDDRRIYALHLTDAGRRTLGAIGRVAREHDVAICAALDETERSELVSLLQRIADEQGAAPGSTPRISTGPVVSARPEVVVVTGTDTGVGKTLVTAGLARALLDAGKLTIAVKPIESGCEHEAAASTEDGVVLATATGQHAPREALVRLRAPLAPALAAEREGISIDMDGLAARIRALGDGADVVLVEGAGGLLSPLTWVEDVTHLARRLDARVLVVGADRLGTLNHVHMTVQVLLDSWLLPLGVVLSAPPEADASTGTNAEALRRRLDHYGGVKRRIAELPRVAGVADAAVRLTRVMDWLSAAT